MKVLKNQKKILTRGKRFLKLIYKDRKTFSFFVGFGKLFNTNGMMMNESNN